MESYCVDTESLSPVLCDSLEGWGMGGKFRKERTDVYLQLIHVIVWQKSTQYCKAIILQFKKNRWEEGLIFLFPRWESEAAHFLRCSYLMVTHQSVQFSHSVVSDSLPSHEPQHSRPPCPSPTPGVYPNPCPLSWWCHPTISSSVIPFSSCPQSFPASGSLEITHDFKKWCEELDKTRYKVPERVQKAGAY